MGRKITAHDALTTSVAGDKIPIVDVSDTTHATSGTTKYITRSNLLGTATAAELSILDGVTATYDELNYLDGVSAGTAVASKALVVDASKDLTLDGGDFTSAKATFTDTVQLSNNKYVTGLETGGTARNMVGTNASNEVVVGNSTNDTRMINGVLIPNDKPIQYEEAGGTAREAFNVDTSDNIIIGDGTNFNEVQIYTMAKARAYLSATQSNIGNGAFVKVTLDTESYDVGGNFASNKFTAPVSGYYLIVGNISFSSGVDGERQLASIYVDGASVRSAGTSQGAADYTTICVSTIYYVAAASYIELYAWTETTAAVDVLHGSANTALEVHLLSV